MNGRDEWGQAIARKISHTIAQKITIGITLFLMFLVFIAIGGAAVQLLWNWLLPDIFAVRRITFLEALGLLALCRILFGGFGKSGGSRPRGGKHRRELKGTPWWKPPVPPTGETAAPTSAPSVPPD
jgi:hypothetical protein